jgi:hypothetical protein
MRTKAVLAVVVGALVGSLFVAAPAQAAQYACDSGTLSAFSNGDVAKWKICVERDSNTYKYRMHAAVWCDNSNGSPVNCGYIYGKPVNSELLKDGEMVDFKTDWNDAQNVHIKNFNSEWTCTGSWLGSYQVIFYNLQVVSRNGQPGTEKTRFSQPTGNMGGCN